MKKKVCFFSSNIDNSGGTERVASIIANSLSNYNFEVVFLSLFEGLQPHFKINEKIKVYTLSKEKKSLSKNYLSITSDLRKFIKSQKIDCIINIESTLSLFVCPAIFFTKVKHINWEHFNFDISLGKKSRVISRYLAALFADYIVTLTQTDELKWKKNTLLLAKILSIPNPSIQNINQKINFDSRHNIALSLGRYTHQKGFDLLIKSWEKIKETQPDWQLWIVGDGEDKNLLEELIEERQLADVVKLIPFTTDVQTLYENANFYIMSSRFEGFPMVLLEACSFGLPIVSFDCPTGPKEIVDHGNNGFLVERNNIVELTSAINQLISLDEYEYQKFRRYSLDKAKSFDINIIIKQWINLLNKI